MSYFTNISTKGKVRYGKFPFAISVLESPNNHVPIGMAFSATAIDAGFGAVAFPRPAWTHFFCLPFPAVCMRLDRDIPQCTFDYYQVSANRGQCYGEIPIAR
jgi:hypothetical protein